MNVVLKVKQILIIWNFSYFKSYIFSYIEYCFDFNKGTRGTIKSPKR